MAAKNSSKGSVFLRCINDLFTGAKHAHELTEVLATEAVRLTLARVVEDYPLDYTRLLQKYERDVVGRCCGMFTDAPAEAKRCGAPTKSGKPCERYAVLNGVCSKHIDAWRQQQEAQRRQEVYASTRRHAPAGPHAEALKKAAGKRRAASMAFPDDAGAALRAVKPKLDQPAL